MTHGEIIYTLPHSSLPLLHCTGTTETPFSPLLSPVNLNSIKTGWRDTKATEETVMMDSVDSHTSSKKTEGEERAQLWWTAKCKPHYWIGRQLLVSLPLHLAIRAGFLERVVDSGKNLLLLVSNPVKISRERRRNLDYTSPHSQFSVGTIKNLT